jgi:molybdate-binding protein/transcriptional regulator with XRE-family HTH domain
MVESYLAFDRIMSTRLSEARRARGWSQAELASRAGVSRAEVSAIEQARHAPSVTVALGLASALDLTVEGLFGAESRSPSPTPAWPLPADDARAWVARVSAGLHVYPVEATAAGAIAHDAEWRRGRLRAWADEAVSDRTLVVAGCDPFVGLLARALMAQQGIRVLPLLRSSTEALDMLGRGLVHAAGVHFVDPGGRSRNVQAVSSTLGAGYRLLHQSSWETGVALPASRRERSPGAVVRSRLRWVNREEGSSARHTFDALFEDRPPPPGHDRIVRDHRAVAATVSSGWAEAGICARPVAREARLGFVTICRESYDLCVAGGARDDPRLRALVAVLRSAMYRQALGAVPGCSTRHTGEWRT